MSFAQEVLDALAPMLYAEATTGDALTEYVTGLSLPFELVEAWASDTNTDIGWSLLLDIDRCPVEALPWLAQIVGLKLNTALSVANQRQQIHDAPNWKRGTPGAMAGAPAPYLTGSKTVIFRERYDGSGNDAPYYVEVITLVAETTDATKVEAVIRAQKPGGIILTYVNASGPDLQFIKDNYATLQTIKDTFLTLGGLKAGTPGV